MGRDTSPNTNSNIRPDSNPISALIPVQVPHTSRDTSPDASSDTNFNNSSDISPNITRGNHQVTPVLGGQKPLIMILILIRELILTHKYIVYHK